jgi:hypothetical protein
VFGGASNNTYLLQNPGREDVTDVVGWLTTMMGNEKGLFDHASYTNSTSRPALNIVTACSTSLVAVCSAVTSLQPRMRHGVSAASPSCFHRDAIFWYDGAITARRTLSYRPSGGWNRLQKWFAGRLAFKEQLLTGTQSMP